MEVVNWRKKIPPPGGGYVCSQKEGGNGVFENNPTRGLLVRQHYSLLLYMIYIQLLNFLGGVGGGVCYDMDRVVSYAEDISILRYYYRPNR